MNAKQLMSTLSQIKEAISTENENIESQYPNDNQRRIRELKGELGKIDFTGEATAVIEAKTELLATLEGLAEGSNTLSIYVKDLESRQAELSYMEEDETEAEQDIENAQTDVETQRYAMRDKAKWALDDVKSLQKAIQSSPAPELESGLAR